MSSSPKVDSFNPAEWYALAKWLFDTAPALSSECMRRTIIGRAYYAALICARDATGSSTFGPSGHTNVVAALRKQSTYAAGKLDSLRLTRHKADYSPNEKISPRDVEICLKESSTVLQELGRLPESVPPHNKPYSDNYLDRNKFL